MPITPHEVRNAIDSARFHFKDERGLQDQVGEALAMMHENVEREVICPGGRIDFVVDKIAIELKVAGGCNTVLRQLKRYAELEWVEAVVLVTTCAKHLTLPRTIGGKPLMISMVRRI